MTVEDIIARAQVIHLLPTDVLMLTNVGALDPEAVETLSELKKILGVAHVLAFDGDADVNVLRSYIGEGEQLSHE